jgi:hypothetical protein
MTDTQPQPWLSGGVRRLDKELQRQLAASAKSLRWLESHSAVELYRIACDQLRLGTDLQCPFPDGMTALDLGQQRRTDLLESLGGLFPAGTGVASDLADQIQLLRAFDDPEVVVSDITRSVEEVMHKFPRKPNDLKTGSNPGDVLDPFILSANYELLSSGDLLKTIETSTAHKVLMKIEDLVGNLHQNTIGRMRGNVRLPEPRGARGQRDKEDLHPVYNPFPGADVGQVPLTSNPDQRLRLFQVKNKTGSAKGGDGKRLGDQLALLERTYDASTFFAAVVGRTLRGHRSMRGVLRASPGTAVVVGETALRELTQSEVGGELLLRTYQRAFRRAYSEAPYEFAEIVLAVAQEFEREAKEHGEDFLTVWLHEATEGSPTEQDSRSQDNDPDQLF